MCGFFGGVSFGEDHFDRSEIQQAAACLRYRGPDDRGEWWCETSRARVALAHTRLSVIDLSSAGHQPMTSSSGRTVIVFNGEIYNYKLLRKELEEHGCSFRSNSDTEVILNGYECWGLEAMLQKLDGMFAFALFDKEANTVSLVRDRFGKKPLYYYVDDKRLLFGSDIRSFRSISALSLTLDIYALGYFFAELSTPHEATIWKEVKKLKPASYLVFTESGITACNTYWRLNYTEDCTLSRREIIDRAEFLLNVAVKKRMIADVNVSGLLSGGIDSSLVVAKMAEQANQKVKTYSVGFREDDFNEAPYARQVAEKLGTDHTELIIDAKSLANLHDLISEFGEPFADSSMIPTYLMCKEIARTEKVAVGGDGGDELFVGYDSYYYAHKYDLVKAFGGFAPVASLVHKLFPSYRTNLLQRLLNQTHMDEFTLLSRNLGFDRQGLKQLVKDDAFFTALDAEHEKVWELYAPHSRSSLIKVLASSLRTRLLNDYLVKVDRASMYASMEMRTPFLDKDLAEFVATLRPEQLVYRGMMKSILKEIAEVYFPKDFVHRSKMGFRLPLEKWYRNGLVSDLKDVVLGGRQKLVDLDYRHVERIFVDDEMGIGSHTHRIWSLYVFHVWAQSNVG